MRVEERFRATVWTQDSTGAWHFVTLPADLSRRVHTLTTGLRKPFGSFRVNACTGRTNWETSLFADTRRGAFLLPIKAEVRRRERIAVGETIEILLTLGF